MRHPQIEQLQEASESTVFLDLRWNEFFDRHTIDTFRPRLSNLPSLVEEILDTCERMADHEGWAHHLSHLQAELEWMLGNAAKQGWVNLLETWQLGELAKANSDNARKIATMLLAAKFKESYEETIFAQLQTLPAVLPAQKRKAEAVLNQLATIALHRGLSPVVEDRLKLSPEEWVKKLLDDLQRPNQEFRIYVELKESARVKRRELSTLLKKVGFKVIHDMRRAELGIPQSCNQEFPRSLLVEDTVEAPTDRTAHGAVIRKLEPIIDMLAFYTAGDAPALPSKGWVKKGDEVASAIEQKPLETNLVKAHSRAIALVRKSLQPHEKTRLNGSLSNALDLYATAMAAPDVRTRFLNLWTALECLGSLSERSVVIKKISTLVCPIVTWRKIEKIARYCAINIHRWRVVAESKRNETTIFPGETLKRVSTKDVINLLCLPSGHEALKELGELTKEHPLLCFRLGEMCKKFENPDELSKSLKKSKVHLEWHLSRIYRARNLLVHSGKEVPYLETLCDNLHYYVMTVLSRILHGLGENGRWTPIDSARHWMMLGDFVIQNLEIKPASLALENLMPTINDEAKLNAPWQHIKEKKSSTNGNRRDIDSSL